MAELLEIFNSRSETIAAKSTAEIQYFVFNATDEDDVKVTAEANLPIVYSGMELDRWDITERVNETTWRITAYYKTTDEDTAEEEPEPVFSFEVSAGTQHVTQSLETVSRYGGDASSELAGAIGVDGDNVNGVDIIVPEYSFSETWLLPASIVTGAYRRQLGLMVGTINSSAFRGYQAGEVMFYGISGSKKGTDPDDDYEMTFTFKYSRNRTDIEVGSDPILGPVTKRGWDYMWIQYGADVDDDRKVLIKKPIAVYVERLYEESDFALLAIGTEEI